ASHLGGVDDAGLHEILVGAGRGVEALGASVEAAHLLDHHAALEAGVLGDLLERSLERLGHDPSTGRLVAAEGVGALGDLGLRAKQRNATTGNDTLFDGRLGGAHGVLDAVLLLLELDLGGRADLQDRDTAGQLGATLLQLLAVVVGVGVLDLGLDLVDATLDVVLGAAALDDRGLVLRDDDLAGTAEQIERDVLELQADLFGDDLTTGEDRHVLQHR